MMKLYDICREIGEVEEGLMYGQISFSYDNLMSAMKPGHPADILDDILSVIGWDVFAGKEPDKEKVQEVLTRLQEFKQCFNVKELADPIKHLAEYLKEETAVSQRKKTRAKKFVVEHDAEHYTVLQIPKLTGKLVKKRFQSFCDMVNIQGLPLVKYYFTLWIIVDDAGKFVCAKAQKVGGADCDGARGGEWYEYLTQREVSLIGNYIINNFMEQEA